jgi:aldehyde:ferredoxin oxidoreductase
MISYDYELIYALGSLLKIGSIEKLLTLLHEVEVQGIDAMSTGVVLAWATEAQDKRIISESETLGLLEWGNEFNYLKAINNIIEQPNDFYKALANGVDYASSVYGGKEFALAFGGNEMPGYHTGPATHINYLTSSRHSHLDSAGYSLDQKLLKNKQQLTPENIVDELIFEEKWRQILSSLVICYFARGVYSQEIVRNALNSIGFNIDESTLKKIGEKIFLNKNSFKFREGFKFENLRIPKRIFDVETPLGKLNEDFIRKSINEFSRRLKI